MSADRALESYEVSMEIEDIERTFQSFEALMDALLALMNADRAVIELTGISVIDKSRLDILAGKFRKRPEK